MYNVKFDPTKTELKQNLKISHRKIDHYTRTYRVVIINPEPDYTDNRLETLIELRIYATNARHYACVWISDKAKQRYANGSGFASGYGYDRESAAAEFALRSAGLDVSGIWGVGDGAIREALRLIAQWLTNGERYFEITECYG